MGAPPFLAALLCPEATEALQAMALPEEQHDLSVQATGVIAGMPAGGLLWQADLQFSTAAGSWQAFAFVPENVEALLANLSGLHREGNSTAAAPALHAYFRELARRAVRGWSWAGERAKGKLLRVRLIDAAALPATAALRLDLTVRAGGLNFPGMSLLLSPATAGALLNRALQLSLSDASDILRAAQDPGELLHRRDDGAAIDVYALLDVPDTVSVLLQAGLSMESLGLLWAGGSEVAQQQVMRSLSRRNRQELQRWLLRHREGLARLGTAGARAEAQLKCRPLLARRGFARWTGADRFIALQRTWEEQTAEALLLAMSPEIWAERFRAARALAGNGFVPQGELVQALALFPARVLDMVFAEISDEGRARLQADRAHAARFRATALRACRAVTETVAYTLTDERFQRQTLLALERYLSAMHDAAALQVMARRPLPELAAALADYPPAVRTRVADALSARQGEALREEYARLHPAAARQRAQARWRLTGHIEELIGTGELLLAKQRPWWWP